MPLIVTPAYLCLLGALTLFLGVGLDATGWSVSGGLVLLAGLILATRSALLRSLAWRLGENGVPIQAEVTQVVFSPLRIRGVRPYRLLCRGVTPPAVGRTFQSGWVGGSSTSTPKTVTVRLDPKAPSRYLVEPWAAPIFHTPVQRLVRHLSALGLVLGVGLVELVATVAAKPEPPPGPVHGNVQVHGPSFGKGGTAWAPDTCRSASNPGVTAVALLRKDEAYPVAWIISDPTSHVAAIDVQRSPAATTVRFSPSGCSRLHGQVTRDGHGGSIGELSGYADAECRSDSGELTLHVDFATCR